MRSLFLPAILSCTFAVACSAEEPVLEDSSDKNLLVRVNRGADQSVSFHAVERGTVLITQTGSDKAFPLQLSNDPITAFQQAAPGHTVPEVLSAVAAAPQARALADSVEALVPDEPVILDLEAPVLSTSFPASSFTCWARNRYACFFNRTGYDEDLPGAAAPTLQTLNLVWAVDRDYLPIQVHLASFVNNPNAGDWYYEVWDGNWMTWSLTSNVAAFVYSNMRMLNYTTMRPNARYHYSSAGAQ